MRGDLGCVVLSVPAAKLLVAHIYICATPDALNVAARPLVCKCTGPKLASSVLLMLL